MFCMLFFIKFNKQIIVFKILSRFNDFGFIHCSFKNIPKEPNEFLKNLDQRWFLYSYTLLVSPRINAVIFLI